MILLSSLAMLQAAAAVPEPYLGSWDISILFPLKPIAKKDGVFKKSGSGFCAAPTIGESFEGKHIGLTNSQFEEFARMTFGANSQADRCELSESETKLIGQSDNQLMDDHQFLAKLRMLPDALCTRKSWRVVGFRLDPCLTQKRAKIVTKDELLKCTMEARLVVQPFERSEDRWIAHDAGLHLIYKVPNLDAMVTDLKQIAKLTRKNWEPWLWAGLDNSSSWTLKPHPGLRSEMDRCAGEEWENKFDVGKRPVSAAIYSFIANHLPPENLTQIAFFAANSGFSQWSFGAVEHKKGKFEQLKKVSAGASPFDSFSNASLSQDIPQSPFPRHNATTKLPNVTYWYTPEFQSAFDLQGEIRKNTESRLPELNDIMHPHIVSQFDNVHCFTCHVAEQARNDAMMKLGKFFDPGPRAYQPTGEIWRHFPNVTRNTTSLYNPLRSSLNFRNFGYGPGFEFGVAERTINETDDSVKLIDKFYGKSSLK